MRDPTGESEPLELCSRCAPPGFPARRADRDDDRGLGGARELGPHLCDRRQSGLAAGGERFVARLVHMKPESRKSERQQEPSGKHAGRERAA
jgi:hypothetical protein